MNTNKQLTEMETSKASKCMKRCSCSLKVREIQIKVMKSYHFKSNLVAQTIKNLPAMQKTLCQEVRKIPWGRKWQATPVFLPGKSNGQRNLAGYSPWGHKELDTTE